MENRFILLTLILFLRIQISIKLMIFRGPEESPLELVDRIYYFVLSLWPPVSNLWHEKRSNISILLRDLKNRFTKPGSLLLLSVRARPETSRDFVNESEQR